MNRTPMNRTLLLVLSALVMVAACGKSPEPVVDYGPVAQQIAEEAILVDTHIDVPYRLREKPEDVSQRTETGDFDYPRAREGGLNVAFMSIYVPAETQQTGDSAQVADQLIDGVEAMAAAAPERFGLVDTVAEIREQSAGSQVLLALGMENGAPIGSLEDLQHFYARGIRYITLTHSENNQLSDSSYAKERQWNGLSDWGREVVVAMNDLGIMVDVSHLSEAAFYQVLETSAAPVIASHSSARHFTPDFERNMDDAMIQALAKSGGVIQINFGSAFVTGEANAQSMAYWKLQNTFIAENGLEDDDPLVAEFKDNYFAESPRLYADVEDVADHIDHVVALVGIDHVGLGSDYDGVGDSLPTGLKDVSAYPNLLRVLLERGYSEEDVSKVAGENLLRVWNEVEGVAAGLDGKLEVAG